MYMEDNRRKIILPFVDNNDCYQLLLSLCSVRNHATLITGAGGVAYCYKTASVLLLSELYVIMSHIKIYIYIYDIIAQLLQRYHHI